MNERWVGAWTGHVGMGEWSPPTKLTQSMQRSAYYSAEADTYWGLPIYDSQEQAVADFLGDMNEEQRAHLRTSLAGFAAMENTARRSV